MAKPAGLQSKLKDNSKKKYREHEHPIMLTLRDVISGDGFLAGITLSGRALMRQEDGAWWMYGVRPAAIAEYGETNPRLCGRPVVV